MGHMLSLERHVSDEGEMLFIMLQDVKGMIRLQKYLKSFAGRQTVLCSGLK